MKTPRFFISLVNIFSSESVINKNFTVVFRLQSNWIYILVTIGVFALMMILIFILIKRFKTNKSVQDGEYLATMRSLRLIINYCAIIFQNMK